MGVEIITKDDLEVFRKSLLKDMETILNKRPSQSREWLKAGEVKKLLKISSGTLLTLRATAKLQYSKIGGTYYYRQDEIQKMLNNASRTYE